jgi:hypothetical protein
VNSPQRIPTVHSFFHKDLCKFLPSGFHTVLNCLRHKLVTPSHLFKCTISYASFDDCGDSIPSGISPTLSLEKDSCMHSLWQTFKHFQVLNFLRLCAHPATTVSQYFAQVCNSKTLLGLHTPCMDPMPNCTSKEMRTIFVSPKLSETNL